MRNLKSTGETSWTFRSFSFDNISIYDFQSISNLSSTTYKFLYLSSCSTLRGLRAETRLTVYSTSYILGGSQGKSKGAPTFDEKTNSKVNNVEMCRLGVRKSMKCC